ncbi:hypothetical protein WR25_04958 [Diploscapter pachys]|uniref:Uncharacterized protein n=1 Tax=Diploscapter pachys TaxID=2018661 RepID=A0A2A2JQU0_9BILA|nr:hypothetical protein WR25_04958 [Diploscapter pachys]
MRRDELKSDHQKRVESMRVEAGEQAAQQTELLDEQLHSQQKLIAAQDNAHQKEMVDTKSAFDDQKLEQDTDLDAKKLEITQAKDLHRENEREIKNKLELTKQEIYREQLLVQKTQIDIQLKHLNVYRTMCNTKDSEKYYTDDYNKVSEQTCNFTMSACEQAIGDLNIGRSSITSRAIGSLKSLSHGLAKREREEFLDALYNLEESEDQLRKLCEQVKSNVNYRYDIGELLGLIKNIEDAKKIFKEQIRYIPAEESVAKAKEQITILEKEVEDINQILFNPVKTLSVAGSSAQHALKQ